MVTGVTSVDTAGEVRPDDVAVVPLEVFDDVISEPGVGVCSDDMTRGLVAALVLALVFVLVAVLSDFGSVPASARPSSTSYTQS